MTGSIKPPASPITPPAVNAPDDATRLDGDGRATAFTGALERAAAPVGTQVQGAPGIDAEIARLVQEARDGRIDAVAVVDTLVERALAGPVAQGLSTSAIASLQSFLRAQLAEDPALMALVRDLERKL